MMHLRTSPWLWMWPVLGVTLQAVTADVSTTTSKPNNVVAEQMQLWNRGTDVYMRSLGYEFEWQQFNTTDGITIKLHHFWKGKSNETGVPVLFQPTLLTNGDIWLNCDPNDCFPFLLADCGYDIWVVNYRGTKYSPYDRTYVSATLDDHIREDLPGAIDFILEKVARKNLHVVSYSKSTTVTFGMLASKPDYNEKVRLHISMMPVTYVENPTAVFKAMLGIFGRLTQDNNQYAWSGSTFIRAFDTNAFFTPMHWDHVGVAVQTLAKTFPTIRDYSINTATMFGFKSEPSVTDVDYIAMGLQSSTILDVLTHHELYQYGQMICAKRFQSFNYSQVPPEYRRDFSVIHYDLTQITTPTLILEAACEFLSQPSDYQRIRSAHKNLIGAYRVKVPNYSHIDGLSGKYKNAIYGRAFAAKMLDLDGDEMASSSCTLNFDEESTNLVRMERDSVAEKVAEKTASSTGWINVPLKMITKDYCKYYRGE